MTFQSNPKPSRTARLKAKHETRVARIKHERDEKAKARRRDRTCRFPLCGCKRLKLPLEVAHDVHKGMGGNPSGDRSLSPGLVLLCNHRHQFGELSFHKGTLRARFLTPEDFDGPVAWDVFVEEWGGWYEIAREERIGHLAPLVGEQGTRLMLLATMDY